MRERLGAHKWVNLPIVNPTQNTGEAGSGAGMLARVAAEFAGGEAPVLEEQGRHMLGLLRERHIVLGTRRAAGSG